MLSIAMTTRPTIHMATPHMITMVALGQPTAIQPMAPKVTVTRLTVIRPMIIMEGRILLTEIPLTVQVGIHVRSMETLLIANNHEPAFYEH